MQFARNSGQRSARLLTEALSFTLGIFIFIFNFITLITCIRETSRNFNSVAVIRILAVVVGAAEKLRERCKKTPSPFRDMASLQMMRSDTTSRAKAPAWAHLAAILVSKTQLCSVQADAV